VCALLVAAEAAEIFLLFFNAQKIAHLLISTSRLFETGKLFARCKLHRKLIDLQKSHIAFHRYLFSSLDLNDVNIRVFYAHESTAVAGTQCDPHYQPQSNDFVTAPCVY
jgi:hypothetical protein